MGTQAKHLVPFPIWWGFFILFFLVLVAFLDHLQWNPRMIDALSVPHWGRWDAPFPPTFFFSSTSV